MPVPGQVAAAGRRVHGGPPLATRFDAFALVGEYRDEILGRGGRVPAGYDEAATAAERIAGVLAAVEVRLVPERAGDVDWLYRNGEVLSRTDRDDGGIDLTIRATEAIRNEIAVRFGKDAG